MCVEKTRAYVKDNKKKLINAVVGWGRPVYTGEENAPLLNKLSASNIDINDRSDYIQLDAKPKKPEPIKPTAKKSSGGGSKALRVEL